jgi:hypothetical protein
LTGNRGLFKNGSLALGTHTRSAAAQEVTMPRGNASTDWRHLLHPEVRSLHFPSGTGNNIGPNLSKSFWITVAVG